MTGEKTPWIVGGAVVASLAILALAAVRLTPMHEMDVRLADGGVAHVRYIGSPPTVVELTRPPLALTAVSPIDDGLAWTDPLAEMERLDVTLDREMARDLMATPAGPYELVATHGAGAPCLSGVEIETRSDGGAPVTTTRRFSTCGSPGARPARPVLAPRERDAGPAPKGLIQASWADAAA